MFSVVKMKGIQVVLVLGVVAAACAVPLDQQPAKSSNVVTGVFIPSDAFKNLQDRANANSQNNQPPVQGGQPNYQSNQLPALTNQQPTQNNQQPSVNNQQPIITVQQQQPSLNTQQQVLTTQPQVLTAQPANNQQIQPVISNNQQPFVYQQPITANRDPKQSIIVMTAQPNQQPNQPIVLLQQPASNQPIYVQQPNQQGNQGYVLPNVQSGQPTQVIIATNPSNGNQIQGTLVPSQNQNQPGSTVYTLIPLNGQNNINSNSGGSFVPVQSGNTSPIILSTGK